jgi:hypothetical protein
VSIPTIAGSSLGIQEIPPILIASGVSRPIQAW